MDLALWDLICPYFLLGNAAQNLHAAFSVIAVEEHEMASDSGAVVIRGTARIDGSSQVVVDPSNLSITAIAQNQDGHPKDDPSRRDPWIDLADTVIDFQLVAPRQGSATIAAALGSAAANDQAVMSAYDPGGIAPVVANAPLDPLPTDFPSTNFTLDLVITAAVLRPPFLSPAKLRPDGLLEPDASKGSVALTLPKIKVRITQGSALNSPVNLQLLSLGASDIDDPGDPGVAQLVSMDPPYAFIGGGQSVGFGFRSATLDLSTGSTPPDVLSQFGFDEGWTGVYFPEIRLFVAPQGATGLAVSAGVKNLLIGIGQSSGVTGDFEADVINQGSGPPFLSARFYGADGNPHGYNADTGEVYLSDDHSKMVVDIGGGRPPYVVTIAVDGGPTITDRVLDIDLSNATEHTIVINGTASGSQPATLTIVARKATPQFKSSTSTGAVPAPKVVSSSVKRGATTLAGPLIEIANSTDTDVTLRLKDGSAATWTVDGVLKDTNVRSITVPIAQNQHIDVVATGPASTTKCPVYFHYDSPGPGVVGLEVRNYGKVDDNTHTAEAVDEPPSSGWTGGTAVREDATYQLALQSVGGSVTVVGHASWEGDEDPKPEYNRLLSKRRAEVAAYIYNRMANGGTFSEADTRFNTIEPKGFTEAKPAQQSPNNEPRRHWWRAELKTPINVPALESTARVHRDPAPTSTSVTPVPPPDLPPNEVEKPDFFRSIGVKLRIVRDQFVAFELHGEVDFDTAAEKALRDKAPTNDMPTFEGLGHQNPGDGIVAFRGVFTMDPGRDDWSLDLTFGADPSDVDGLAMTGVPAGQVAARSTGRDILGLYVLFMPLLAEAAPDDPTDPGNVGDLVLTGALAGLPILLAGTGWVKVERVIWYGGELVTVNRDGAWSQSILADLETAVSADIKFGGQSIVRIDPARPLVARYKAIGIRFGKAPDGSPIFRPVFDSSKGYTLDIARGGSLEVAEPLGSILKVLGARISRTNPLMFEIELGGAVDLGVVSLDKCGVRVRLDNDPPTVELTSLGASVDIPGALTGSGYFRIDEDGFAGRIDLTIVPVKLRVAAALNVRNIPALQAPPDGATAVAVAIEVDFPVAIPLGSSGLGLYGLIGLFAMHFERNEQPDQASATKALSWLKRAGGDPTHIEDPTLWTPAVDHWAFGVGALIGTMGSDVIFNLKGMLLLELPGPRVLLMMKANLLMPAPDLKDANAEGTLLAVVDLNVAEHSLTIGIVIDFTISPILELHIPVEAFFDTDEPEKWHIYIGKFKDPIRAKVLEVFTGTGYLMLAGDGATAHPDMPDNLPATTGFTIATGLHVSMVWGSKSARLYAELAAGFDAIMGFSPLLVAGKLYARGELVLFIISISAHADLDVRLGDKGDGTDGYKIHGEVCGSIDLFFFSIEGCVDFTLENNSPPDIAIPDLVSGVSLVNRSPALVHGTGSDGPVDGSLAEAVKGASEPNWGALPEQQRKAATIPINAIPLVNFTAPPFEGPHPGNPNHPVVTFMGAPLHGGSGGREVSRSEDKLNYELNSVSLTGPIIQPSSPPTPATDATPATWWTLRPPNKANESAQLALLSWVPTPTPKALQRSETLDETVHDRWGTVCHPAAPPTSVLWTFRFEPLGPDPDGWWVDGEAWPDLPDTVRSTPTPTVLRVTERWRCGDPYADLLRGISAAYVTGALVSCPRPPRRPRIERPDRIDIRSIGRMPLARDVIGRKRPELLDEAAQPVHEVMRRLETGMEISRAAMTPTTTAFPAAEAAVPQRRCESRVLAAPCLDRLEPVPPYRAGYKDDVVARWAARKFEPGDLADAVVLRPGAFVFGRVLLFVPRRLLKGAIVVRLLDANGAKIDEHVVDTSDEVTWATLPGEWTMERSPWDDDVFLVMQHLTTLAKEQYTAVLVEMKAPTSAESMVVGVHDEAIGLLDKVLVGPPFYVAAFEALMASELARYDYDQSTASKNHQILEASLGANSGKVALLQPNTTYRVDVDWGGAATNSSVTTPVTRHGVETYWFRTAAEAPDRLDAWVLATKPYEGERHMFGHEPIDIAFATPDLLDLFDAYGYRLEVRLQAASSKHPTVANGNLPHPTPLDLVTEVIPASVLSPWEDAVVQLASELDCIDIAEDRDRHLLSSIALPLDASTDYLLDIERVPKASPAGTRGDRVMRRSFTTSRFPTLAGLAEYMRSVGVVHRYAPGGAIANMSAALTTDTPLGESFDAAMEAAGLGRLPVPTMPAITVYWEGTVTPQPTAVLIDCSEPLWRQRESATLVTLQGTDIQHWELERKPWVWPDRSSGATTNVTRTIQAPGGQRGLVVLAPGSRGTRLLMHLFRKAFKEPYLDGPSATDETAPIIDIGFHRAPWEEVE